MNKSIMITLLLTNLLASTKLCAQQATTEKRFQDLFVTASYGTAFGAAMGAAVLSFQKKPEENLRFVAIGASIGFITGSLFGSYIAFSPVFHDKQASIAPYIEPNTDSKFVVRPIIKTDDYSLGGVVGEMKIASF